jgi:predicted nucleic acid-binding Zn ribbon protein
MTRTCKTCQTPLPADAGRNRVYCSRDCQPSKYKPSTSCVWCGKPRGDRNVTCSDTCSQARNAAATKDARREREALKRLKAKHEAEDRNKTQHRRFWDDSSGCWVTERI